MQKPAKTEHEAARRRRVVNKVAELLVKAAKKALKNEIDMANFLRAAIVAYEEAPE